MPARNTPTQTVQHGHKLCSQCAWSKPLVEFDRDTRTLSGRTAACRPCRQSKPSQHPSVRRERNRRYKAKRQAQGRLRFYGVTEEQFQKMLADQGGVCAICGNPDPRLDSYGALRALSVDHCHETKLVRGLLCHFCNVGIGHFRDDPKRLRLALAYLEQFGEA